MLLINYTHTPQRKYCNDGGTGLQMFSGRILDIALFSGARNEREGITSDLKHTLKTFQHRLTEALIFLDDLG